jgi:hypothetical protein
MVEGAEEKETTAGLCATKDDLVVWKKPPIDLPMMRWAKIDRRRNGRSRPSRIPTIKPDIRSPARSSCTGRHPLPPVADLGEISDLLGLERWDPGLTFGLGLSLRHGINQLDCT